MDKEMELRNIVAEQRERADNILKYGTRVKGDAARADQKRREALDQIIAVGNRVRDVVFGDGTILKVNKKICTVEWDQGFKFIRDKILLKKI
jgi:hypothetical protein